MRHSTRLGSLAVVSMGVLLAHASTWAAVETYHFGLSPQRSNVSFESKTDFETVLGSSNRLTGDLTFDRAKGTGAVVAVIPVTSLKTGIDLRDQHLRGPMWLDAKKFPTIKFLSRSVKRSWTGKWEVKGDFTMHGVTKPVTAVVIVKSIPQKLAKKAGLEDTKWVKVSTTFRVSLKAHGLMIPKMAAAKVSDEITIRMNLFASAKPPKGKKEAESAKVVASASRKKGSIQQDPRERSESAHGASGDGSSRERSRSGSETKL